MTSPVRYEQIAHLPLADRIDLVCDVFERERRQGVVRPLEEYVAEVPEPEREAFLSELRTVERGLSNASTIMDGEPTQSLARPPEPPEPTVPRQLGRYRVQERLGRGAFGEVWRCFDPELHRQVAVKVLLRERFASDKEVARFLDEARKLAQLRHPGIVAVYDVGCQGGYVFLVSEYIPGGTLQDRLKKGPLPPSEAAELLAKVAEAVHYAHKKGLVHRDLKPSNILIDTDGQPRVADFGLAVHEDEQRRRAGEIAGTPAYMSPEQVRGESHLLDGRADIWAIGVILYQCLTGRRPFNGDGREEVFEDILRREPKPPRQIDEQIPIMLEQTCLRCLRKAPVQRPSNALDLSRTLRLSGVHQPLHRRRMIVACVLGAVVVLGLGIVGAQKFFRESTDDSQVRTPSAGLQLITERDVWVPFLERSRKRVVFDPNHPLASDYFDPDLSTYHLTQGTFGIVSFGEVAASGFEAQATFSIRDWIGFAGLFWGLRDERTELFEKQQRCFAVHVGRLNSRDSRLRILVEELTLRPDSSADLYVYQREQLAEGRIAVPTTSKLRLRLVARKEAVPTVLLGLDEIRLSEMEPLSWPTTSPTQFGLLCNFATSSFEVAEIRVTPP